MAFWLVGASADYLHGNASGESYGVQAGDEFDANNLPLVVPLTAGRRNTPSNLSRVSMSIMKELSNAEWKIDPSSLVLGKMIGKGGFGEQLSCSFPLCCYCFRYTCILTSFRIAAALQRFLLKQLANST